MRICVPTPTRARVLIEEDIDVFRTLARILEHYGTMQDVDPSFMDDVTQEAFLGMAKTLKQRIDECEVSWDYQGEKYIIMAKGRRRLSLGFKREPDIFIGSEYGTNFIEACRFYFKIHRQRHHFDEKNLTYFGRSLFGLPAKDVGGYAAGIKSNEKGHSVWFTLCSQTYTLAHEENLGDAELRRKLLCRTFDTLITLKKTKPQ